MPTTKRLLTINSLPDTIRGRLALMPQGLVASEELQGTLHIINLTGRLRPDGVEDAAFVPASRFDAEFARYASRSGVGENVGHERVARAQTAMFRELSGRTGINFISGATGSGKSTALSHCMEALNEERPGDNFLSIEDPPEKPIKGKYQIPVISREGGERGVAYTEAIAGTNRDDTDTVMIGEVRYAEAALATIEVALSGNSVWATIHAADALGIIQRLDVLLRSLVANPLQVICDPIVLSGLVFQRLVPMLCPHCKIPLRENRDAITKDCLNRLKRGMPEDSIYGGAHGEGVFLCGHGCEHCKGSGHPGLHRQTVMLKW